ncbi:MAG TPA: adenylyl-sulfate kinase, partial [Cyanothece sp. UBA12306]|nr:adenylyl-sulfate kinase [Cyanothece sp. UBA12306]
RDLAKIVANFHDQTPSNEYITSFGNIEIIKKSIEHNYQLTESYIEIAQTQEQYQETKSFTDRFFVEKEELFLARKKKNKIKECHGDLHLKNICLWNNQIQLFDRIEFNEEFRFIDTMSEIAFTVMDLEARGRRDLSNIFLNTYLEYTGDWSGLTVLPLYLTRQAYVRAKVTSMLLDDPNISSQEKQAAIQTASHYYRLAWQYTKPSQGCIILMSGLSGSGKTTVANYLAQLINAIQIRSDAVRKHLAKIPLTETGTADLYSPQRTEQTYKHLLELGEMVCDQGFKVILDAKFDRSYWREQAIKIAHKNQIPLYILHCHAPLDKLRDRLDQRQGDISDATANLLHQQQATAEPFNNREQSYIISVDTSTDWQTQIDLWSKSLN